MNRPHPDEIEADARLLPHARAASGLVRDRLSDARAHARLGDRATARRRLDELARGLGSRLSDARAGFYRAALARSAPGLPPDLDEERVVRSRPIGHPPLPPGSRIREAVHVAARTLGTAIGAGDPAALDAWHARHTEVITRAAHGELSDSQMGIENAIYHLIQEQSHG